MSNFPRQATRLITAEKIELISQSHKCGKVRNVLCRPRKMSRTRLFSCQTKCNVRRTKFFWTCKFGSPKYSYKMFIVSRYPEVWNYYIISTEYHSFNSSQECSISVQKYQWTSELIRPLARLNCSLIPTVLMADFAVLRTVIFKAAYSIFEGQLKCVPIIRDFNSSQVAGRSTCLQRVD